MYWTPCIATPFGVVLLRAPDTPDGGEATEGRVPTGSAGGRLLLAALAAKLEAYIP